jgi:DNA-binding MarR family transcriptional regulator
MELTPSTVSRFIDTLAGRGLVARRTEGKVAHIDPTPEGIALQAELTAIAAELMQFIGQRVSTEDRKVLLEQTAAIRCKLEEPRPA